MSKKENDKVTKQIMYALIAGLLLGLVMHVMGIGSYADYLKPVGDIFIRLLKMMIIPVVLSSIFVAMVNLGTPEELGSIGLKALGYYFATTAIAAFIGLVLVNLIQPGNGIDLSAIGVSELSSDLQTKLSSSADDGLWKTILSVLMDAIPSNPFQSMAESTVLQVIVFAILLGMTALFHRKEAEPFISFMKSLEHISMALVHGIMKVAPIGIFALMIVVVAQLGFEALLGLSKYMVTVIIGLMCHFVFLVFVACWRSKRSPIWILKGVSGAVFTAFSTASSAATLPITMASVEDNLGVDAKTAQFVLPLGATVNMDGTALYESVAVIFIGQAYGLDLGLGTQIVIFLTASLAAVGAAAIPGAGLITMSIVLSAVGFPLEGIGLILAVDRILDMFRTAVNVFGDCVGSVFVDSFLKKKVT